ncbi:MAG TPA: PDZ domain-containing protein [Acidobacteriaceae bacterium]|jgi:S1-C subfamily serine protease|nr:PDZ domain-containing protein [Acidobacteriaceae bacterium]
MSIAAAFGGCVVFLPVLSAQSLAPLDGSMIGAAEQHVVLPGDDPAMVNTPSQGYLGVGMRDVDTERASQLRLKDVRGAEIVTVDHDAPAAKAGLRIHDVILGMNNQPIDGQAQLTRMLHDTPAGRTVTLLISRDGQIMTLTAQLADRATIEANAWSQHIPVPDPDTDGFSLPASGFGNNFIPTLGSNPFYTGLDLDMLGPQLANYFGVHDGQGLLVTRVDDNSPGSAAGLRAGDVITKVNGQTIATTNQWMHAIHANRGKQVQLTVIRDRKENVVPMMAGRSKEKGGLDTPDAGSGAVSGLASASGPNFAHG